MIYQMLKTKYGTLILFGFLTAILSLDIANEKLVYN